MAYPPVTSVLALEGTVSMATYAADARIAAQVSGYWTMRLDEPPARLRIVPDGRVDLVFDLLAGVAHVSGVRADAFEVEHTIPTRLLGVTLLPGVAPALLGVAIADLGPEWRPLATVLGPAADALAAQLRDAEDAQRIALLESFLMARLGRVDERIERAVRAIADADGDVDIARIGRESGSSARNLSRLFHAWVGLSPKKFARIVRAQAALRMLADPQRPDLSIVAETLGFADQAHLTREVRAMAGAAPGRLAETFKAKAVSFKK
jgi:AraC-like DNA-binding protein